MTWKQGAPPAKLASLAITTPSTSTQNRSAIAHGKKVGTPPDPFDSGAAVPLTHVPEERLT